MTPETALLSLLDRIAYQAGEPVFLPALELANWPHDAVAALIRANIISKAPPASSVICEECEAYCPRPVYLPPTTGRAHPVIFCDRRDDVHAVDISPKALVRWKTSASALADALAAVLEIPRASGDTASGKRWEIGLFRGLKHAGHLVLILKEQQLALELAGHQIALDEVLFLDGDQLTVDRLRLRRLVDNPVAGGGDVESAEQRAERLWKRRQELKAQGVRAYNKTLAQEEGISPSRLKQILQRYKETRRQDKANTN